MKALLVFLFLLGPQEDTLKNWANGPEGIILSKQERTAWRQLGTDEERRAFISAFWAARDPGAGAAENEYRQNFEARVAEANRLFGGEGSHDGWQTERGRFYVLLGKPLSRIPFKGYGQLRPMELWLYAAPRQYPQLPPFFNLLFYQRDETGNYRRYSPFIDQPQSLVKGNAGNNGDAWRALRDVDPDLAHASLSLIPSEPVDTAAFSPSMASDAILAQISQIPKWESERAGRLRELVGVTLNYPGKAGDLELFALLTGPDTFTVDFSLQRPPELSKARVRTVLWREDKEIGRRISEFDENAPLMGRLVLGSGSYDIEVTVSDLSGNDVLSASRSFDLARSPSFSISDVLMFDGEPALSADRSMPFAYAGYRFAPRFTKQLGPGEKLDVLFQLIRQSGANDIEGKIALDYTVANINNGAERWTWRDEVEAARFDSNGSLLNSKTLTIDQLHVGRYFLVVTATDPTGRRTSQTQSFEVTSTEVGMSSRQ
jgi:GWxTD domain-containing protein